jgi:DNA-binding CsgD family transcriptional regulator
MEQASQKMSPVIELLYEAAGECEKWQAFLNAFLERFDGIAAALVIANIHSGERELSVCAGEHFKGARNALFTSGWEFYRRRIACCTSSGEIIQNGLFGRPEFQSFQQMTGTIINESPTISFICVMRHQASPPFEKDELSRLQMLMPHLQRAVRLHQKIHKHQSQSNAASGVFDQLAMGIILLDDHGSIVIENKSAECILTDNDGIAVKNHRVTVFDSCENSEIQCLIRAAIQKENGNRCGSSGQMLVMRASGKRPYMVFVTPLNSTTISVEQRKATVAIYITDPERRIVSAEEILKRLYRLTVSEAKLATLLVEGKNVEEASQTLDITTNTTRTHLKSIFHKTETRGQSDLIRLVLNGTAAMCVVQ